MRKEFGYNVKREQLLKNLRKHLEIFISLGVSNFFIVGSFISAKQIPNDIDVCIDTTGLNLNQLKYKLPHLFSNDGLNNIKLVENCHLIFYDVNNLAFLNWFRTDRNGNIRGLVQILLNDT